MILLALDIATRTGFARGPIDGHRIVSPTTTNIDTVRRLNGLAGIAEMVAHKRGLPVPLVVQNTTIKKHWTGSGRARKPDMVYLATQRGWRAEDDNHADALALWDYTAGQIVAGLWTPAVRRKGAA